MTVTGPRGSTTEGDQEPGATQGELEAGALAGLSRRGFLARTAAAGAGVLLVGATDGLLSAPNAAAAPGPGGPGGAPGYGPLVADPAQRLALPQGFRYTVVSEAGVTKLDTGQPSPTNSDGTGAFRGPRGGTVLVQNHELRDPLAKVQLAVPPLPGLTYDPAAAGGTTTISVDRDGNRLGETVSLAGTSTNCAGGITPWTTWLSCEETEDLAGTNGFTRDHGYVFEVDPFDQAANRDPQPIKALGRFPHEAVAVDPANTRMYLTEDAADPNGLLYRWTPPQRFRPGKGALRRLGPADGAFEAMSCTDRSGAHVDDLSRATEIGTTYRVRWTAVPDRDARTVSTRKQLPADRITRGRKLEGAWWGDGGAYVVTSFAREESPVPHDGQVWFHDPRRETLRLVLRFGVNPTPDQDGAYDGPDNITVSPWGGVILAEDGEGIQHLVGATTDGRTYPIARNDRNDGEMTGPVYSADQRILFANLYEPGTMYAITGPWRRQR